jgi:hypothetical protein
MHPLLPPILTLKIKTSILYMHASIYIDEYCNSYEEAGDESLNM